MPPPLTFAIASTRDSVINIANSMPPNSMPPPLIFAIASTRDSPGRVDLTWKTVPHTHKDTVDHYSAEYATTDDFTDAVEQVVPYVSTPDTSYGVTGLTHGPSGPR